MVGRDHSVAGGVRAAADASECATLAGDVLAVALGAGAAYLALCAFAFSHGLVLPVVAPFAALLLAAFAVLLVRLVPSAGSKPEGRH